MFGATFALSAVTGAGKTVIATAVIEAILHGSAELDTAPDPRATFLWVTDDPALNRQTRNKMLAASDVLNPSQLTVLGNDFLDPQLAPARVYFLNIQQLSKLAGFARGGRNLRQYSGWDVIAKQHWCGRHRPLPRLGRSASRYEAHTGPCFDRAENHRWRIWSESSSTSGLGYIGNDRAIHQGYEGTDVSGTHEPNINAIADAGITLGCNSDGTLYCPDEDVTRGQMAAFLHRALG